MVRNKFKNRVFRYNRRTRGLTDYKKRLEYLKSGMTRLVVRRTNKSVIVQFVDYEHMAKGDKILKSASSLNLLKLGYKAGTANIVASYLTGYLSGKRVLKAGFKGDCIVDLGLRSFHSQGNVFAAVKGAIDAGVNVKLGEGLEFASESRLKGEHLSTKGIDKIITDVKSKIDKL